MSLIARLMDKRNQRLISKVPPKKEQHLDDAKKDDGELYAKGVYTNGIQGL